jgi:hypothetical protein
VTPRTGLLTPDEVGDGWTFAELAQKTNRAQEPGPASPDRVCQSGAEYYRPATRSVGLVLVGPTVMPTETSGDGGWFAEAPERVGEEFIRFDTAEAAQAYVDAHAACIGVPSWGTTWERIVLSGLDGVEAWRYDVSDLRQAEWAVWRDGDVVVSLRRSSLGEQEQSFEDLVRAAKDRLATDGTHAPFDLWSSVASSDMSLLALGQLSWPEWGVVPEEHNGAHVPFDTARTPLLGAAALGNGWEETGREVGVTYQSKGYCTEYWYVDLPGDHPYVGLALAGPRTPKPDEEGFFLEPLVFQRETVSANAADATAELAAHLQQLQSNCGKRITTLAGLDGVSVIAPTPGQPGEAYWQHGPVVVDVTTIDVPVAQFEQLVRDLEARLPVSTT